VPPVNRQFTINRLLNGCDVADTYNNIAGCIEAIRKLTLGAKTKSVSEATKNVGENMDDYMDE
jgi:hypothetical protein